MAINTLNSVAVFGSLTPLFSQAMDKNGPRVRKRRGFRLLAMNHYGETRTPWSGL